MKADGITDARATGLTIGELSRRTGVPIETIRYYERIAIFPAPPRTAGGRRIYSARQLRTLTFIRRARELGFALSEIRTLLALGEPGEASCASVHAVAARHLDSIRARISGLQGLATFLAEKVSQCSGEDIPDCAVLDALYPADASDLGRLR
jgi:MerR family mercuric resistance operon transcriptional regulator